MTPPEPFPTDWTRGLVLVAHPDDPEYGMSAAVARWTAAGLMKDPEDSRVMVPKRPGYGVGTTVNVGSRGGRALVVGFFALIAVALPAVLWIAAFSAR